MVQVIEVLVLLLSGCKERTSIESAKICPIDLSHVDLRPVHMHISYMQHIRGYLDLAFDKMYG
jgi:hypothetical protein